MLVLVALVGGLSLSLALPRPAQPARSQRRAPLPATPAQPRSHHAPAPALSSATAVVGAAPGVDPNLPVYVGASRRLAAGAIDAIASSSLDAALSGLGHRFLGTPPRPVPPGSAVQERLVLDLTAFDEVSFIEQLLALANSRKVRTRTEATDRFSDHVRQLRYGGGRVDACARLRQASLWALAAQRRGYLVDLSPYLPGARQRRVALRALLADPAAARGRHCPLPLPTPGTLVLADLPLAAVPAAQPSLRSGDLVVLRGSSSDRFPDGIGLVEISQGRLGALLLQPGRGVVRIPDLVALARGRSGIEGMAFYRPLPNQDGQPDR